MSEDDDIGQRVFVSLPSERFHTTSDSLTRSEWLRRHALTYPTAAIAEDEVA